MPMPMPMPQNYENLSDDELIDWLIGGLNPRATAYRIAEARAPVRHAAASTRGQIRSREDSDGTDASGTNGQRMGIEQRFNISLIAALALREKQIQQNYRPIIGVHKWFARRPGSLFRGLILAEFGNRPIIRDVLQRQ